jgi:hypothetical protein
VTTGGVHASHLDALADAPPPRENEPVDVAAALRRVTIMFAAASDALLHRNADATKKAISRVYVTSPRLHVAEVSTKGAAVHLSLDLRRDHARTVVLGFQPQQLFLAQVMRGVIDGALERLIVDDFAGGGAPNEVSIGLSTSAVFERLARAKGQPVLLARNVAARVELPAAAQAWMDESLAAGQIVVTPDRAIDFGGGPRAAWWQVDPRSGTTIAVTDEGLHQAIAEGRVIEASDGTFIIKIVRGGKTVVRVTAQGRQQAVRKFRHIVEAYNRYKVTVHWHNIIF